MFAASKTASVSGSAPDAQFNYVTMLLHGDGTNGAQNNTFLDSSTNNFTITRNGNTTQGSFSPYGSNWSFNFPTTNATFRIPASANLAFGTGNFTFETWLNSTHTSSLMAFWGSTDESSWTADAYAIGYDPTTTSVTLEAASTLWSISTGSQISDGLWHHIAVVRNSGTWQVFIDGVSKGTTTSQGTRTLGNSTYRNALGSVEPGGNDGRFVRGYMSNCRIGNTAVYTSNFTPSTTPLTAISGTQLLTCQSNRFIDNSANNFTFTKTGGGTPSVQRFNPFGTATAYSTSVIGGSGYFDGSGDNLTAPDSSAFDYGSGDFTLECWIYPTTTNSSVLLTSQTNGGNFGPCNLFFSSGALQLYSSSNNSSFDVASGASVGTPIVNQWSHVAVSRSGTSIRCFLNGTLTSTTTSSATLMNATNTFQIASRNDTEYYSGYISNFRVVKGTAVYTAAFTPPTAPLTAISGTSLLVNMTNGAIFDNAMMNDLETVGNAQISTSVVKYGTGSMYFDGNGDYLSIPTSPNLNMATGNFTVECWVYISSRTLNYPLIFGNNNSGYGAGALALTISNSDSGSYNDRFILAAYDANSSAPTLVASSTNSSNTWYYLALVRNGTSLVMYRDGTSVASATISSSLVFDWGKLGTRIGGGNWDGAQSYFNGYIDDLRITKGYARYTATFTPPTAAFPNTGPI